MIAVLLPLLSKGSWQAQQGALQATKGMASQSGPALRPWVPALIPALLAAACHSRPEVSTCSSSSPSATPVSPLDPMSNPSLPPLPPSMSPLPLPTPDKTDTSYHTRCMLVSRAHAVTECCGDASLQCTVHKRVAGVLLASAWYADRNVSSRLVVLAHSMINCPCQSRTPAVGLSMDCQLCKAQTGDIKVSLHVT